MDPINVGQNWSIIKRKWFNRLISSNKQQNIALETQFLNSEGLHSSDMKYKLSLLHRAFYTDFLFFFEGVPKICVNIFGVMGDPKQVYISAKFCEKKSIFTAGWCWAPDIATTRISENRL